MKILRIRLTNLNSLKGPHSIDLSAEPLASAGLFAITGSTGAGKTTILDAITLALYGKAARYGNESNPEHVMSRHCGECSAEVEFEVPSGVYRAVWERHRARKRADGALQQPKRYIYDAAGQPLVQQIREAEQKIEELLGLNYERFLRSVLLAQGDFARFLKAKADERAELLESLTGTAIYSRLGRQAHVEAGRREDELKVKEGSLQQIPILEDEARKDLEAFIKQGEEQREKLTKEIAAGAEMLGKIASLEGARKREKEAVGDKTNIDKEQQSAAANLERLRLHRLTVPFAGDLIRLEAAEATVKSATGDRKDAVAAHAKASAALAKANYILRASTEAALAARQREAKEAGDAVDNETKIVSKARAWLDQHKHDAGLADQVGDLAAAIGELKNARSSLSSSWTAWRLSSSEILPEDARALPETLETTKDLELDGALHAFLDKAGRKKNTLELAEIEVQKQFDLRKDHLEKAKLVAKLEDHRHDLKSGDPCPLCGALQHPYAEGAAPGAEISQLQKEVNKAKSKVEAAREAYRTFAGTLTTLTSSRGKLLQGVRDSEECCEKLDRVLKPLAVKSPAFGEEDALRTVLQEREKAYRNQLNEEVAATNRKSDGERKAKKASEEAAGLKEKLEILPPLPDDLAVEPTAPEDLPPVPEAEEAYAGAVNRQNITSAQAVERKKDETKATEALGRIGDPLQSVVAGTEFRTLENLRAARLTTETAKAIEDLDSQLKRRTMEVGALLNQAREDISKLLDDKVLEGDAAENFKAGQGKLKGEWDKLLGDQATRAVQIKTDDGNRKLRMKKEEELEGDRKALVVWRRLKDLIGSHDGSKFRRYAQTISLDILTRHANRHLARLSDRYRICRDSEEALNLQIEDLHQAGVKRPMASLSGGESFLVSLALALGLSDLAGRTVRIDSLFIDEGFGSLDSETLEVAIAALESLRQDHKTVGVISHVDLLKTRISTQILVEKQAGGVSKICVIS